MKTPNEPRRDAPGANECLTPGAVYATQIASHLSVNVSLPQDIALTEEEALDVERKAHDSIASLLAEFFAVGCKNCGESISRHDRTTFHCRNGQTLYVPSKGPGPIPLVRDPNNGHASGLPHPENENCEVWGCRAPSPADREGIAREIAHKIAAAAEFANGVCPSEPVMAHCIALELQARALTEQREQDNTKTLRELQTVILQITADVGRGKFMLDLEGCKTIRHARQRQAEQGDRLRLALLDRLNNFRAALAALPASPQPLNRQESGEAKCGHCHKPTYRGVCRTEGCPGEREIPEVRK